MSFNDDVQLDTSQVESGGGGGRGPGGMVIGGGLGGIILLIVALIFGINPSDLPGTGTDTGSSGSVESAGDQSGSAISECKTGADANKNDVCRVIGTVNSVQAYWASELPRYGKEYPPAKTVLYKGATQSACGTASNQVGPFYCPLDQKVYLDMSFYSELHQRFGAPGDFAQAYVIAHEVGHHVQNLVGTAQQVREAQEQVGQAQANDLSVRMELQADCFAGVWAATAQRSRQLLSEGDIEEALGAASAIGDDRIQRQTQGYVVPDAFTHGSGEQRQRWFMRGYEAGRPDNCDTFKANPL